MEFSKEAQSAINYIFGTNKNVFITGKAGTGKSTLLSHLRLHIKKKAVVLAPTGISAINVNGETIHSFFSLKPGFEKEEAFKKRIDEERAKKYRKLDTIFIDEISMVRADLLDAIDIFLRKARKSALAFGGVQMIFIGDLYQLPPVVTPNDKEKFFSEYKAPYFFNAEVFRGQTDLFSIPFELINVELTKIYRQSDSEFIEILNAIRTNQTKGIHFLRLNSRYNPTFVPPKDEKYIYLVTTNAAAKEINKSKLSEINEEVISYDASMTGDFPTSFHPNDLELTLKVGAQIMFIYNDPERRWVNGTLGKVIDVKYINSEDGSEIIPLLLVEKEDGQTVEVTPFTWEISKYIFVDGNFEREIMGTFRQLPIKLAWAITIHKSQGKTFDKVIIDLGRGSFAHGQTYVALSRCTSLEGIVLKKKLWSGSIIMDERVKQYFDGC